MDNLPTNQSSQHAPTGVVLVAFGKPQYYWAPYNLAYSIKRFNTAINVALVCDTKERACYYCSDLLGYIDSFVELPEANIYTNKKIDPGKAKVLLSTSVPPDTRPFGVYPEAILTLIQ